MARRGVERKRTLRVQDLTRVLSSHSLHSDSPFVERRIALGIDHEEQVGRARQHPWPEITAFSLAGVWGHDRLSDTTGSGHACEAQGKPGREDDGAIRRPVDAESIGVALVDHGGRSTEHRHLLQFAVGDKRDPRAVGREDRACCTFRSRQRPHLDPVHCADVKAAGAVHHPDIGERSALGRKRDVCSFVVRRQGNRQRDGQPAHHKRRNAGAREPPSRSRGHQRDQHGRAPQRRRVRAGGGDGLRLPEADELAQSSVASRTIRASPIA